VLWERGEAERKLPVAEGEDFLAANHLTHTIAAFPQPTMLVRGQEYKGGTGCVFPRCAGPPQQDVAVTNTLRATPRSSHARQHCSLAQRKK